MLRKIRLKILTVKSRGLSLIILKIMDNITQARMFLCFFIRFEQCRIRNPFYAYTIDNNINTNNKVHGIVKVFDT